MSSFYYVAYKGNTLYDINQWDMIGYGRMFCVDNGRIKKPGFIIETFRNNPGIRL